MTNSSETKLVIPPSTILMAVATLLALWVVYQVRDILTLFLAVVAIVVTFSPLVKTLQKYIPRTMAIVIIYFALVLGFLVLVALILPPIISQLSDLVGVLEQWAAQTGGSERFLTTLQTNLGLLRQGQTVDGVNQILGQLKGSLGVFYNSTLGFIGGLIAAVTVFITSFYLLLEEKQFHNFLSSLVPESKRAKVGLIMARISNKMGDWLRGQFLLMVIVGVIDGIALAILGVPYALLLGLWAGLMELIPLIGPIAGAIPGVILAFSVGGLVKGLIALGIYLLVQQLENQFLIPKIMGRALGLSPVIIIFSLLVWGKLFGLFGVIIAVPLTAILVVIYEEWRK